MNFQENNAHKTQTINVNIRIKHINHGQDSWWVTKITFLIHNSYCRHFGKKKYFFSVNQEEKPAIVSVQSIYSSCNKIEEHS